MGAGMTKWKAAHYLYPLTWPRKARGNYQESNSRKDWDVKGVAMTIARGIIEEAVNQVVQSHHHKGLVEAFSGSLASMSLEDAYRVQYGFIQKMGDRGQKVIGHKVAVSGRAAQERLGIGEPAFGQLMDPGLCLDGSAVSMDSLVSPIVEAEVAFLMGEDLKGPGVTPLSVLKATEGVLPAIEIADPNVTGPSQAIDMIARNVFNAGVVLGTQLTPVKDLDLRHEGVVLELDGEPFGSGTGVEVMGNPVNAVAWLANKLAQFDDYLRAGEVIISGTITRAAKVEKGNYARVTFTRLGSVGVKFV
jgi:2-keto-4-pentenoate hydratase